MGGPLLRVSVTVPPAEVERARAIMLELFPQGFEERDGADGVELAAYTDAAGEERLWAAFGGKVFLLDREKAVEWTVPNAEARPGRLMT